MIKISLDRALNEKFTEEDFLSTLQSDNIGKKFALSIQLILTTDRSEYGFQLLKGLKDSELSLLVEENFIADLIANSPLSSPDHFFKLIHFVLKADPYRMAIQKHLSTYGAQSKQKENNENITLVEILHIIDYILEKQETLGHERLFELCSGLLGQLSKMAVTREVEDIKHTRNHASKIADFFKKVPVTDSDRLGLLQLIYRLLSHTTVQPSPLLSLGLCVIPDEMIHPALDHFFSNLQLNDTAAKESILATMERLIYWLRTTNMPVPYEQWIITTIQVLNNSGMHEIVDEVAKKNMPQAFISLVVPIFQSKTLPVVQALLENSRKTKELLDLIAPRVVNVLKNLEHTKSDIFEPLMEMICDSLGLVNHSEAQYAEIMNFLKVRNRTPPKVTTEKQVIGGASYSFLTSSNPRVGLQNLGNTCYLNSILQALFMTKQFCRKILLTERSDMATCELQKLFALMLCSPRPEQNPHSVVTLLRPNDFMAGIQHDSSEFLGSLLDRLHEQENKRLTQDDDWDTETTPNIAPFQPCDNAVARTDTDHDPVPMDIEATNEARGDDEEEEEEEEDGANGKVFEPMDKVVDNTAKNLTYTYIQKIFGGKICTRYLCKTCNSNSINVDAFRDLQLSFPERQSQEDNGCDMQYNVQQLLEYYFSTEELNLVGDNQYHCDNCKILRNGIRCTEILEPPKNLILTLKHFRYDSRHHTRSKLLYKVFHDELISVNVKGSLETNSTRSIEYKLYAAVIHTGNSLDNGHYYTIAREDDQKWFKFNDSFVSKSSIEELRGLISPNTPYILFYQRQSQSTSTAVHAESDGASASIYAPQNVDSFPEYQELSIRLRDYIDDDKVKYENDLAMQRNIIHGGFNPAVRNNFDDNNDPGTGSSFNLDPSFGQSRFIF